MKIITNYEHPPIPDRRFDWSAVQDGYDGSEGSRDPIGRGATEAEAIADLLEQVEGEPPYAALDAAYAEINALGGVAQTPTEELLMAFLDQILAILEKHGAMDPAQRRALSGDRA